MPSSHPLSSRGRALAAALCLAGAAQLPFPPRVAGETRPPADPASSTVPRSAPYSLASFPLSDYQIQQLQAAMPGLTVKNGQFYRNGRPVTLTYDDVLSKLGPVPRNRAKEIQKNPSLLQQKIEATNLVALNMLFPGLLDGDQDKELRRLLYPGGIPTDLNLARLMRDSGGAVPGPNGAQTSPAASNFEAGDPRRTTVYLVGPVTSNGTLYVEIGTVISSRPNRNGGFDTVILTRASPEVLNGPFSTYVFNGAAGVSPRLTFKDREVVDHNGFQLVDKRRVIQLDGEHSGLAVVSINTDQALPVTPFVERNFNPFGQELRFAGYSVRPNSDADRRVSSEDRYVDVPGLRVTGQSYTHSSDLRYQTDPIPTEDTLLGGNLLTADNRLVGVYVGTRNGRALFAGPSAIEHALAMTGLTYPVSGGPAGGNVTVLNYDGRPGGNAGTAPEVALGTGTIAGEGENGGGGSGGGGCGRSRNNNNNNNNNNTNSAQETGAAGFWLPAILLAPFLPRRIGRRRLKTRNPPFGGFMS